MNALPCRFHRQPVPVVASDRLLKSALGGARLRLLPLTLREALEIHEDEGPCLLELTSPDARTFERVVRVRPDLRIIAMVHDHSALEQLPPSPLIKGYMLRGRFDIPEPLILEARQRLWADALGRKVTSASQLHPLVRQAILEVISRRSLSPTLESEAGPHRTVEQMARAIHCPARRLSYLAGQDDVNLQSIAEGWIALLALAARNLEGRKWERIAMTAGYADLSGLSRLMVRVLGSGPGRLSGAGIEDGLRAFEERIEHVLSGRQQERSGPPRRERPGQPANERWRQELVPLSMAPHRQARRA